MMPVLRKKMPVSERRASMGSRAFLAVQKDGPGPVFAGFGGLRARPGLYTSVCSDVVPIMEGRRRESITALEVGKA